SEREHVQSAAVEVWQTTGYCFIVHEHFVLQKGHKTYFWCSQDDDKKQRQHHSEKEGVRHHDKVGMKCDQCTVSIRISHHEAHIPYYDIAMPSDAVDVICDNLEWNTPSTLVLKIHALYLHIMPTQVHSAWTRMSEVLWKKNINQLTSAQMLLGKWTAEVEVFTVEILEGVEQLCWGMTRIAHQLSGKVVEIGLDATYKIIPQFIHVDKDMAKISMSQSVWPSAKIQLCWWHLQKAVHEQLAKSMLTTTPYKPLQANHEFSFISVDFWLFGITDPTESKGGALLEPDEIPSNEETVPSLSICILNLSQAHVTTSPLKVFCPMHLHDHIIQMMEQHFCTHPLIPGYSHPSPAGICQ
ncbi:hypothetical protein ID866_10744, partial [Astraeus odoratus]